MINARCVARRFTLFGGNGQPWRCLACFSPSLFRHGSALSGGTFTSPVFSSFGPHGYLRTFFFLRRSGQDTCDGSKPLRHCFTEITEVPEVTPSPGKRAYRRCCSQYLRGLPTGQLGTASGNVGIAASSSTGVHLDAESVLHCAFAEWIRQLGVVASRAAKSEKSDTSKSAVAARAADVASRDAIVAALYDSISGPAGDRDWDRFRSLFIPEAQLIASFKKKDGTLGYKAMTVQGYIDGSGKYFKEHAFYEREISRKTETWKYHAYLQHL
jgi:hypothetical protein